MPTLSFLGRPISVLAAVVLAACGGDAVVDAPSSSSSSGGGSGTSTNSSASTGGPRTCMDHSDCGSGEVCIFATGACAPVCNVDACDSCGVGNVCNTCASSSCPTCADCLAACRPIQSGSCDDDDPCPAGQGCDFTANICRDACPTGVECNNLDEFCSSCASGTCCGCDNCQSLCLPGF